HTRSKRDWSSDVCSSDLVLAFSAQETAQVIDCSVAATNSALQRARATLRAARSGPDEVGYPTDAQQRALVDRYVSAFESHDVDRSEERRVGKGRSWQGRR